MAVIGEMDIFGINKDKQYEVVDRKSRQSIEKINKDINNSDKDVTAGKVWKSTNEGAGWADSDSMSDNQSGGVDITINGVKRTLQRQNETSDSMADNENGGVDITIGGTKKTVAKQADLKEIEKSQNELKGDLSQLSEEKVDNPPTGAVGQILEIETVDENGKPKTYKAVDKPTVPDWAKQPQKPTYTASEVGADATGTAESKVSDHNVSDTAHNDIRLLIKGLTTRLNVLADSDDTTLDQMSEVVAYIKSNKSLIDSITTSKVSVSDIVDNLTSSDVKKPLSAKQGAALKALVDAITIPEKLPNPKALSITVNGATETYDGSEAITIDIKPGSYVNVKGFGAVGDGVIDDTIAIQNAIDHAFDSGKMKVYLPAGTYKISSPLLLRSSYSSSVIGQLVWDGHGVEIFGDNKSTTIIRKDGETTWTESSDASYTNADFMKIDIDSTIIMVGQGYGIHIHDLYIYNNSSASETYAIYGTRSRTTIESVNVHSNHKGIAMKSWFNTIRDVRFICPERALCIDNSTSSVIEKTFVSGCANPYYISSAYSNLFSVAADDCTGDVYTVGGTSIVINGCGTESKLADTIVSVESDSHVIVNGLSCFRQTNDGASLFKLSSKSHLSAEGISLYENSNVSGTTYIVNLNTTNPIEFSCGNIKRKKSSSAISTTDLKLINSYPNSESKIFLNLDGINSYVTINKDLTFTPYDGYSDNLRSVLATSQIKVPTSTAIIDSNKRFIGQSVFDALENQPKWWNGEAWVPAISIQTAVTNQLVMSIGTDGNIYNNTGYKTGYRIGTDGADLERTNMWVTGFIPVSSGDVFRIYNLVRNDSSVQAVCFYKSDFSLSKYLSYSNFSEANYGVVYGENNFSFVYGSTINYPTLAKYVRFCGYYDGTGLSPDDAIILINEELGGYTSEFVPAVRTINDKPLKNNIVLTPQDIGTYGKDEIDNMFGSYITEVASIVGGDA